MMNTDRPPSRRVKRCVACGGDVVERWKKATVTTTAVIGQRNWVWRRSGFACERCGIFYAHVGEDKRGVGDD